MRGSRRSVIVLSLFGVLAIANAARAEDAAPSAAAVPSGLEALRAALSAKDAMVVFATTSTEATALVVTPSTSRIVALGPTAAIVDACERLAWDDRVDVDARAMALAALVTKPLGLGSDAERVLVVPDGALAYIPFALLLPDRIVAYEASGTAYRALHDARPAAGSGILALGDPDYSLPTSLPVTVPATLSVRADRRFVALPGTRREATAIGDEVLLGADASESGLWTSLAKRARWRAVHFACHSTIDVEHPMLSALALTPKGDDDGLLTCLDVARTSVHADLVVLSASDTAKGRIVAGEGVVGLTRAFLSSGASRVLSSIGKVDDDATAALMAEFYRRWNPRDEKPALSAAEALRKAQERVRAEGKWRDPSYWAGWQLWGLPD